VHSISACVTLQQECDNKLMCEDDSDHYYDDSDLETDSECQQIQCVVCKLVFTGDSKYDQHRRITHHWGCSNCQLVFHSCDLLNLHKEAASHWTDDEFDDDTDDEYDDEQVGTDEEERWGEMDRLL